MPCTRVTMKRPLDREWLGPLAEGVEACVARAGGIGEGKGEVQGARGPDCVGPPGQGILDFLLNATKTHLGALSRMCRN